MKREKFKNRLLGTLFLVLAVPLGLVFLACVLLAIRDFDAAWHARDIWPWLASMAEPGWEGAMYTLEDEQAKLVILGVLLLLFGLGALAGGIVLTRKGWKRRREGKT